jgi:Spy/CpxP family protein refolding chaperone
MKLRTQLNIVMLSLAVAATSVAQSPPQDRRGGGPPPGMGRGGPGGPGLGSMFPWWESGVVKDLNLSEDQMKQIRDIQAASRAPLSDLRTAGQKADVALEAIFNEDQIDWQKAGDAIERATRARADLTRALSQLSLKLRSVLTIAQWQELQRRRPGIGPGGPGEGGRRGGERKGPPRGEDKTL